MQIYLYISKIFITFAADLGAKALHTRTHMMTKEEKIEAVATMDQRKALNYDEAINLVRQYKQVIAHRFEQEPRVMMFGSYSKGSANPDSDIDVAVIVPTYGDRKMEISRDLWSDTRRISFLIEPVLMADDRPSPLYDDVMRTGIAV